MDKKRQPGYARTVRYPLSWPAWLAKKVAEAADARATTVAAWMREAAIEKLERQYSGPGSDTQVLRTREHGS